ncbi:hypothetical protein BHE74_00046862 [Ensete ventricosum]|nr:hypothetical protein BHE74_00046862 [Ensete ventricosum]
MGNADGAFPGTEYARRVPVPPPRPFLDTFRANLKETFFPDDPLRQFRNERGPRRVLLGLKYFLPILEWAPTYSFGLFKADLIAGITIASLAIPQGISYAKLANLPPILGMLLHGFHVIVDSSFVPPLVYAMMGSSRDLAVGTVAVASLLIGSMLGKEVSPTKDPALYLHLAFTATFFAGLFQAALGLLRYVDRSPTYRNLDGVGFMGGAATVVCLQQLKGMLGLQHFTTATDLVSVVKSVFSQVHQWRWESAVLGCCFLFFLLLTRFFVSAPSYTHDSAPLTSVILGSVLVYLTHAENHGVQVVGSLPLLSFGDGASSCNHVHSNLIMPSILGHVSQIGYLKKGLNPPSATSLTFMPPYIMVALKTGIVTGVIALAVSSLLEGLI